MQKCLVSLFLVFLLFSGCATDGTTTSGPTAAQVMDYARTGLALAQVGYADYALISGKNPNPRVVVGMKVIDDQLDFLGKMKDGKLPPDKAAVTEALKTVDDAKATMAVAMALPTK